MYPFYDVFSLKNWIVFLLAYAVLLFVLLVMTLFKGKVKKIENSFNCNNDCRFFDNCVHFTKTTVQLEQLFKMSSK